MKINENIEKNYLQDALTGEPINEPKKIIEFTPNKSNSQLQMKINFDEVYQGSVQSMKLISSLYTNGGNVRVFTLDPKAGGTGDGDSYYFTRLSLDGKFKPIPGSTKVRFFMGIIATPGGIPTEPPYLNENQFAIYRLDKDYNLNLVCYTNKVHYKKLEEHGCVVDGVIENMMDSSKGDYFCAFIKHINEEQKITMPGKYSLDYTNIPIENNPFVLRSEQPRNDGIPTKVIPKEDIKLDNNQSFYIQFYN